MSKDKLIGKVFPVLDQGEVVLVDVMGDDSSVVQAARISYGKGTSTAEKDRALIRFLMRHRHTTPFEMAELKFRIKLPMDAWRQGVRHRTASVNEYSTRYSPAIDAAAKTKPTAWRLQSSTNRQGSGDLLDEEVGRKLSEQEDQLQVLARRVYEERLAKGVAREQARKDLPLSTYTALYWKVDLHNLLHFLGLRMASDAQSEIRQYANVIGSIVEELFPVTWEAFVDYHLEAVTISRFEVTAIRELLSGDRTEAEMALSNLSGREQKEFHRLFLSND